MSHQSRHRVLFPIWVRFVEPTQTRRKRRVVGEGALEDPKQRRGCNGLFEFWYLSVKRATCLRKSAGEDSFSSNAAFQTKTKRSSAVTFPMN